MKVSRPTWFPKDSAGGRVTNRSEREGPSSSGFSGGGNMATLMAGHRKMEESKQVKDDPSTHRRSKCIRGELRALIRHPWLQSPG